MSANARPSQDMPPKGGFPRISHTRYLPTKGFSGITVLLGVAGVVATGFSLYIPRIKAENERRRARQQERMQFLEALDKHQRVKFLGFVRMQAMQDALEIDKALKAQQQKSS